MTLDIGLRSPCSSAINPPSRVVKPQLPTVITIRTMKNPKKRPFELCFWGCSRNDLPNYVRTHKTVKAAELEAVRVGKILSDWCVPYEYSPACIYGPGLGEDGLQLHIR